MESGDERKRQQRNIDFHTSKAGRARSFSGGIILVAAITLGLLYFLTRWLEEKAQKSHLVSENSSVPANLSGMNEEVFRKEGLYPPSARILSNRLIEQQGAFFLSELVLDSRTIRPSKDSSVCLVILKSIADNRPVEYKKGQAVMGVSAPPKPAEIDSFKKRNGWPTLTDLETEH
jgi:hypothetical protein